MGLGVKRQLWARTAGGNAEAMMRTNDEPRPRPNPVFHVARPPPSKDTAGCVHMDFSRRRGQRPELLDPLQLEQEHFSHEDGHVACCGDQGSRGQNGFEAAGSTPRILE